MIIEAFAKVNLSLRVHPRDSSGYHPIRSLIQSIGWSDTLSLEFAEDDRFTVTGPEAVTDDNDNLAWRAVTAVRDAAGSRQRIGLGLDKHIPVESGLGGGSADAAAGLMGASRLLDVGEDVVGELAATLGSDVAFCLTGGTAWMEGHGGVLTPIHFMPDYTLAMAVPSISLSTAEVYRRWDRLEGPSGVSVGGNRLPPSLRELGPLGNDLLAAALDLRPDLGDWMADLAVRWERPVLLTGSGSALFAFFMDDDEAAAALAALPPTRGTWSGLPQATGWRRVE